MSKESYNNQDITPRSDIENEDEAIVKVHSSLSARKPSDFKETPKYHDNESYVLQRHHFIGSGIFNTDELDDLPPRYRERVLKAYEKVASELAAQYPQARNSITVANLLTIGSDSNKNDFDTISVQSASSRSSQKGKVKQPPRNQQRKFNQAGTSDKLLHEQNKRISQYDSPVSSVSNLSNTNGYTHPKQRENSSCDKSYSSDGRYSPKNKRESEKKNHFQLPFCKHSDSVKRGNSPVQQVCDKFSSDSQTGARNQRNKQFTSQSSVSDKQCNGQNAKFNPALCTQNGKFRNVSVDQAGDYARNRNSNEFDARSCISEQNDRMQSKGSKQLRDYRGTDTRSLQGDQSKYSDGKRRGFQNFRNLTETDRVSKQTDLSVVGERNFEPVTISRNSSKTINRLNNQKGHSEMKDKFTSNKYTNQSNSNVGSRYQDQGYINSIQVTKQTDTLSTHKKAYKKEDMQDSRSQYSGMQNTEFQAEKETKKCNVSNSQGGSKASLVNKSKFSEKNYPGSSQNRIINTAKKHLSQTDTFNKKNFDDDNHQYQRNSSHSADSSELKYQSENRSQNSYLKSQPNAQRNHSCVENNHLYKSQEQAGLREDSQLPNKNSANDAFNKRTNLKVNRERDSFRSKENNSPSNRNALHHRTNSQNSNRSTDSGMGENRDLASSPLRNTNSRKNTGNSKQCLNNENYSNFVALSTSKQQDEKFERSNSVKTYSDNKTNKFNVDIPSGFRPARVSEISERIKCEEKGFFVQVTVSKTSNELEFWKVFFENELEHCRFVLDYCCKFTESLILNFNSKNDALKAVQILRKVKHRTRDVRKPHLIIVSNLKYKLIKPCICEKKMIESSLEYFKDYSEKYIYEHRKKITEVEDELTLLSRKRGKKTLTDTYNELNLNDSLATLIDMEVCFKKYVNVLENKMKTFINYFDICKLKSNFSRECNSFKRCLPIYARKAEILELLNSYSVTVVSAETGSGKTTQLAEYLLQSWVADRGTIVCTQPRKVAAISVANYVCSQIGTSVGKLVGYDVGIERKYDEDTRIIYMTDYALLKKFLRNRQLKGISCVIIDEAHERNLNTDLLLGMLKELIRPESNRLDFRIIITSATIDPSVFVSFFDFSPTAVIDVPGRTYPVRIIWNKEDVEVGWDYVKSCVETAIKIHIQEPKGDILVFLTSPSEIDESILKFREMYSKPNMPDLLSLHGKSDLKEQMEIFKPTVGQTRRIIFATNAAETSLTIPGIKYVIDSGMAKELMYFPEKNKSSLVVAFINKSSAEQRTGRGGRTQPGICYRMYSKKNFEGFSNRACPEILKTNLQKALLKIYQLGINPESFDFVEAPSKEAIIRSLESLEHLGLIQNNALTKLGKKAVELPVDPQLSKLILEGINAGVGYEAVIMAAMVSEAGRLFVRGEALKLQADKKKIQFCQDSGDLCTYLEVYKRWREVARSDRFKWCLENFVSSKAMNSAAKTIEEILICLHQEFSIRVLRRYNNSAFQAEYENIIFSSFSENLCIFSGHIKVGYFSPYFTENLYIHPSSSLNYLGKDFPPFLVYSNLMQTSRNFLMDITPVKEKTLNKACKIGQFNLQADMLKSLQILPKTLGPFGESILKKYILGTNGMKIANLELMVEKLTRSRNFRIDVSVEKGTIDLYLEKRFHEKVSKNILDIVNEAHGEMAKEDDVCKMSGGFSYFCLGKGGIVSDIILPGEFKEIVISNVSENELEILKATLHSFGDLQSIRIAQVKKILRISATYMKVENAQKALVDLRRRKLSVQSNIYVQDNSEKALPLYRLQVSWPRATCDGTGFVEFDCEADKIQASFILHRSINIGGKEIGFPASELSPKELNMINLPRVVSEKMIREELLKILPSIMKVKRISIRHKLVSGKEEEMQSVKKQLLGIFRPFSSPNNMVIDVNFPKASSISWNAVIFFMRPEDGERAFRQLSGRAHIDNVPVSMTAIIKAHLFCKEPIFRAVQKEVEQLKKQYKSTITWQPNFNNTTIDISFSSQTMKDLFLVRQNLVSLVQGHNLNCLGNKIYYHLFTLSGKNLVLGIQKRTQTYITLDNTRKSISVYGSRNNCLRAKDAIQSLVTKSILCNKKVFNLKNSCMPSGFLKNLYVQYGLDLEGLISKFDLKSASLDTVEGTLTIEGSEKNINRAESHLEEICCELYKKGEAVKKVEEGKEFCTICLDPLNIDYYRLENCGHAFCKSCLLLQVESKIIPLTCIRPKCGKEFFLIDIKKILTIGGEAKKMSFYDAALQYHVSSNLDKISYCPIPDCNTVYRISSDGVEYQCPGCENVICTYCQAPYHYGMSCDIFQNSENDEDYSLKVWMQDNINAKQCPSCGVVIEKDEGCNHMMCGNCKAHMCWLCLKVFPESREVYDHQPYCPNNQGQLA